MKDAKHFQRPMNNKLRQITVFTEGDSSKLATWSNVPYFFTETLIEMDYKVNRVNISVWNLVGKIYDHSISQLLCILFPNHAYQFERTPIYNWLVEQKLKKYVEKDKNSDLYVFMSYTFYNKWNKVPSITFSDWSYDYYIKKRCNRTPYFFEHAYLRKQFESFTHTTLIVSLFKGCADYMKQQIPRANVTFIGNNVINIKVLPPTKIESIIKKKQEKLCILFVGMKKYLSGAQLLIEAFKLLKVNYPNAELHIVGMDNSLLHFDDTSIYYYGYLHKDVETECRIYYKLLKEASIFVNPTKQWAGYSSTVEAMYYYTPIIVSPYNEFTQEFGHNIDFGLYNEIFDPNTLRDNILRIFTDKNYEGICLSAHNQVKDYTWHSYMLRLLKEINNCI